jgi:hypothetical protein
MTSSPGYSCAFFGLDTSSGPLKVFFQLTFIDSISNGILAVIAAQYAIDIVLPTQATNWRSNE